MKAWLRDDQWIGDVADGKGFPIFDIEIGEQVMVATIILGTMEQGQIMGTPLGFMALDRLMEMSKAQCVRHVVMIDEATDIPVSLATHMPQLFQRAAGIPEFDHHIVFVCDEVKVAFSLLVALDIRGRTTGIHAPAAGTA